MCFSCISKAPVYLALSLICKVSVIIYLQRAIFEAKNLYVEVWVQTDLLSLALNYYCYPKDSEHYAR